ncbi:hypothetical protein GGH95_000911, partial [Coemansia sp. RSA 1836]
WGNSNWGEDDEASGEPDSGAPGPSQPQQQQQQQQTASASSSKPLAAPKGGKRD